MFSVSVCLALKSQKTTLDLLIVKKGHNHSFTPKLLFRRKVRTWHPQRQSSYVDNCRATGQETWNILMNS